MHYISRYNYTNSLDRLARSIGVTPSLNTAVASLSRFSLRDILNDKEIIIMYQHKTMLAVVKKWANSEVKIDVDEIRESLARRERYFVPEYVMKLNTPRYHAEETCKFLMASFENFRVPPEIELMGPEKVREFQEFCERKWPSYRDKPLDIFWAYVGAQFRVSINPTKVSYSSTDYSGYVGDMSETELLEEIHSEADKLRNHIESNELSGYRYAPPRHLYSLTNNPALDGPRRQVFLELLKLKKAIKMLVFNFHRIELEMPEGLLSDELLEALGFLPCKVCCSEA